MTNRKPVVTVSDFRDTLAQRVVNILIARGYLLCSPSGHYVDYATATGYPLGGAVGVMFDNPEQADMPRRLWGLMPPKRLRRVFLGVIWLDNSFREATPSRWVFEVYGSHNLDQAHELAKQLARQFEVNIDVRLLQGPIEYERFHSDYNGA